MQIRRARFFFQILSAFQLFQYGKNWHGLFEKCKYKESGSSKNYKICQSLKKNDQQKRTAG